MGVRAEEVFVNLEELLQFCLFNKILACEELQVPVGAVCPPRDMRDSVSLWIPFSAPKASFGCGFSI